MKYCGGCDPGFNRTDYVRSIKNAAGATVQWVTLDEGPLNAILLVNGCFSACAWKAVDSKNNISVVSVCDGELSPENIVKILIKSEGMQ